MSAPIIYVDACVLIDLAQSTLSEQPGERGFGIWITKQALKAGRENKARLVTSMISVAECTSIAEGIPSPPDEAKRFYESLLLSGRSGLSLVQMTQSIALKARDLRWVSSLNLKGADAVHAASAIVMRCNEFWTRDGKIWKSKDRFAALGLSVIKPSETQSLPEQYRQSDMFDEALNENAA